MSSRYLLTISPGPDGVCLLSFFRAAHTQAVGKGAGAAETSAIASAEGAVLPATEGG